MKRLLTGILMMGCFGVGGYAGAAWINNIYGAVKWYLGVLKGEVGAKIVGPIKWLNWSAIDCSTVTTFIPFFGLLCIAVGLGRIIWKRNKDQHRKRHFPFFPSYNAIMVTFGLLGTIWGIIMMGYYKDPEVKDLIGALHTALYSTGIALIWVYLIGIPVKVTMRWWDRKVYSLPPEPSPSRASVVIKELGAAASVAAPQIGKLREVVEGAIKAFQKSVEVLNEFVGHIKESFNGFQKIFEAYCKESQKRQKLWDRQISLLGKMEKRLERMEKRLERMEKRDEALRKRNEELLKELNQEKQRKEALSSRLRDARRFLEDSEAKGGK